MPPIIEDPDRGSAMISIGSSIDESLLAQIEFLGLPCEHFGPGRVQAQKPLFQFDIDSLAFFCEPVAKNFHWLTEGAHCVVNIDMVPVPVLTEAIVCQDQIELFRYQLCRPQIERFFIRCQTCRGDYWSSFQLPAHFEKVSYALRVFLRHRTANDGCAWMSRQIPAGPKSFIVRVRNDYND
jgi:hypothetical protein